jgi:hypothetical protein
MTKILTGVAALMIIGAAALPVPASAVEQGITKAQPTDVSSQRRHWRHYRHYGHRYWVRGATTATVIGARAIATATTATRIDTATDIRTIVGQASLLASARSGSASSS